MKEMVFFFTAKEISACSVFKQLAVNALHSKRIFIDCIGKCRFFYASFIQTVYAILRCLVCVLIAIVIHPAYILEKIEWLLEGSQKT